MAGGVVGSVGSAVVATVGSVSGSVVVVAAGSVSEGSVVCGKTVSVVGSEATVVD